MAPEITLQGSLSSDDNAADGVLVTERVRNSLHNPTETSTKFVHSCVRLKEVNILMESLKI